MTQWKLEQFKSTLHLLEDLIISHSRYREHLYAHYYYRNVYRLYELGCVEQGIKDSGIGSQGVTNSINMMTKVKTTVINLPTPSYTMG